jgi:hypothetical protein
MSGDASEHRWYARRIPDDFRERSGQPQTRLDQIIRENWWQYDEHARSQLTHMLLPALLGLSHPDGDVTDQHRDLCERCVAQWLSQR